MDYPEQELQTLPRQNVGGRASLKRLAWGLLGMLVVATAWSCGLYAEDRAEESVLATLLEPYCDHDSTTAIQEWTRGQSIDSAGMGFLKRNSSLVDDQMLRSFVRRNRKKIDLRSVYAAAGCQYLGDAQFHAFVNSGGGPLPPPPGSEERWELRVGLTFSRVGFNRQRTLALVDRLAGGNGMCLGEYLILRNEHGEWRIRETIQHLIC